MSQSVFDKYKPEDFAVIDLDYSESRPSLVQRIKEASEKGSKPVHLKTRTSEEFKSVQSLLAQMLTGEIAIKVGSCDYMASPDNLGAYYKLTFDGKK